MAPLLELGDAARPNRATGETSLVLVGGFAGSGKTEFGQLLAAVTGWALLDKDALTRPLTESLLLALGADPNDRQTDLYKQRVRPLEYRCLQTRPSTTSTTGSRPC